MNPLNSLKGPRGEFACLQLKVIDTVCLQSHRAIGLFYRYPECPDDDGMFVVWNVLFLDEVHYENGEYIKCNRDNYLDRYELAKAEYDRRGEI